MTAYSYDQEGRYTGPYECQRDPVRSESAGQSVYLLPADATWTAPPAYDPKAEIPVWSGTAWTVEKLPEEPELPPDPKPEPGPTLEERVGTLEKSKANQADVDELHEALDMILTGVTV